jgi:hypothetical protein
MLDGCIEPCVALKCTCECAISYGSVVIDCTLVHCMITIMRLRTWFNNDHRASPSVPSWSTSRGDKDEGVYEIMKRSQVVANRQ